MKPPVTPPAALPFYRIVQCPRCKQAHNTRYDNFYHCRKRYKTAEHILGVAVSKPAVGKTAPRPPKSREVQRITW